MGNLRSTCTFILSATFIGSSIQAAGQLTVDNTNTPVELVEQILVGQGVAVSNVTFNGMPAAGINDQIGSFNGSSSALGLNSGILLGTGRVPFVTGPNNDLSATVPPASPNNTADADLLMISSTTILRDQAILEFDFVPLGDSVSFRFVFASEEYPEFVCSQWNDVFAFFLSGPGITGPFTNGAVNLALVPNTAVPIAINTVNAGSPGVLGGGAYVCAASDPNWQNNSIYYVDNTGGSTLQLDAFTVPMIAGTSVQCGQTYHLKIAIADAGDSSVDSAVFLEGGSFSSTGGIAMSIVTPQNDGTLTEGCGEAILTLVRDNATADLAVALNITGSAGLGDILALPDTVLFPAGVFSVDLPFSALEDATEDSAESLSIEATVSNNCQGSSPVSVSITLLDHQPIQIAVPVPELGCSTEWVDLNAQVIGGLGDHSFLWSTGDTMASIVVPGLTNGTYSLIVTDECPRSASITVNVDSGCELEIPNVFTPNNDGHNDAFVINGIRNIKHTLRIYNRWGQVLLETDNYMNNWRGSDLSDGTYFYEVYTPEDGRYYTGSLTLLDGN